MIFKKVEGKVVKLDSFWCEEVAQEVGRTTTYGCEV